MLLPGVKRIYGRFDSGFYCRLKFSPGDLEIAGDLGRVIGVNWDAFPKAAVTGSTLVSSNPTGAVSCISRRRRVQPVDGLAAFAARAILKLPCKISSGFAGRESTT